MQKENQQELTGVHLRVWTTLANLQDGSRVVGKDLMAIAGISDKRQFFSIIEDLRMAAYQIGASKELHNPGYYQIRTDQEAWNYHFQNVQALEREIERNTENTQLYFLDKYGAGFDFLAAKNKEELRRFAKENK